MLLENIDFIIFLIFLLPVMLLLSMFSDSFRGQRNAEVSLFVITDFAFLDYKSLQFTSHH